MKKYIVVAPAYLTGTQNYMQSLKSGFFEMPPSLCWLFKEHCNYCCQYILNAQWKKLQTFLLEHVFVCNLFNTSLICMPAGFFSKMYYWEDIYIYIYHCDIFLCCCHTLIEIQLLHNIIWKYLGDIRLSLFWIYCQNCSWLQFGNASDFFQFKVNVVVLANGYINMAVFILSGRY